MTGITRIKSELIPPVDLKLTFRRCHNAMYRQGIDSEDVALDMTRVILAKIEDESSSKEECEFHITPEEYADKAARKVVCNRVRKLFDDVRDRYLDVFSPTEKSRHRTHSLQLLSPNSNSTHFLKHLYIPKEKWTRRYLLGYRRVLKKGDFDTSSVL